MTGGDGANALQFQGENTTETPWHARRVEDAASALDVAVDEGLGRDEIERRRKRFGPNRLPAGRAVTAVTIIVRQFLSPLIYILAVAAVVSVLIDEPADAAFILAVILLNAGLGAYQELRAEQSAQALQVLMESHATVLRNGVRESVPAEDLVPGDVVILESGTRVPADLRLVAAQELAVDQSLLTGESEAVSKDPDLLTEAVLLADRSNMAFAGTTVMSGRGRGIVTATGSQTEVGRIAATVTAEEPELPPLSQRMEAFARRIAVVVLGATLVLAVIGIIREMAHSEVFFLAVALAVSAIPEGLPVAITVALSIGASRMAGRNVIVRQLAAVEGLGSCTYIASDKTGTLTVNQQTVRHIWLPTHERFEVTGEGYAGQGRVVPPSDEAEAAGWRDRVTPLITAGILCNEGRLFADDGGWRHHGDAVDVALLALGYKFDLDPEALREQTSVVGEIPFESERRYAAVFYRHRETGEAADAAVHVAVKGAVETVIPLCDAGTGGGNGDPGAAENEALALAEQGCRVLAVAGGTVEAFDEAREEALDGLTLLGLVALMDPLRPEAAEAVRDCRRAGVEVAMVRGIIPRRP